MALSVFNPSAQADVSNTTLPDNNCEYNQPDVQEDIGLYQEAQLFKSLDEDLQPVDMQDLIDGRPLVLVVGSCTCQPAYLNLQVLEDTYQQYKDRVNFVWVYSREAHPDGSGPSPATTDVGWNHPNTNTTSMEERAQRAKWLKTDLEPDAEIPIILDYINTSLGQDNAIKGAYYGGGCYSGYVIDCDGQIIASKSWAWAGPDSSWMGLPLTPISDLHGFLDDYLANLTNCYDAGGTDLYALTSGSLGNDYSEVVNEYCLSSGDNKYEWIAGVQIGSLNNVSGSSGYTDFTSQTLDVSPDETIFVGLTPGFSGNLYEENWKIWIDYNRDGDFEDPGEEVLSEAGSSSVEGSFTVPGSAEGVTLMRVSISYGCLPTSCGTFRYGEVEDYTVNIGAAAPTYMLLVASGSGDGNYEAGTNVSITADTAPAGQVFDHWEIDAGSATIADVNEPSTTLSMPATNMTITAMYISDSANGYCTSSGNSKYEWIAGVQIGSLNNTSASSGYTDFTSQALSVSVDDTVSVVLTPGFSGSSYKEYFKIRIDYNRDGDFEDPGEEVLNESGSSAVNGSFTVPEAAEGVTRMRVSMSYGSAPPSCGTFRYGEVEDYTVNISAGAPTYALTVASGSGDGSYAAGTNVGITANTAPSCMEFDHWVVSSGSAILDDVNAPDTTLTMPAGNVTVTATYKSSPENEYCISSGNNVGHEWIAGVHIGTLNNTSGASGYSDFTEMTLVAYSADIKVTWDANTEEDLAGYKVYTAIPGDTGWIPDGTSWDYPGELPHTQDVGNITEHIIPAVLEGPYAACVTAYDISGNESDYSEVKTINVSTDDTVSVNLTPGFSGSSYVEYWKIWIDSNRDGDFEDPGEEVFSQSGRSAVSGSFTVPGSASGVTRMRVSMSYNSVPPSCGTFSYGEVEDYTVSINSGVYSVSP